MAISERIHFFRLMRGMTQKYLGTAIGFPEKSADVRLAQYETGTRKPKADLTNALAQVLDVSPQALDVPDIDSYIGLMHTLFTLEDIYGLTVSEADGEVLWSSFFVTLVAKKIVLINLCCRPCCILRSSAVAILF